MSQHDQLREILNDGLSKLGLSLDEIQQDKLITYVVMLDKWNSAYNLSGIKNIKQMVTHHLLDSLAIIPLLDEMKAQESQTLLDVGTGAGLPGIPLAICYPEKKILLLDSNGKKTRFLFQVKTELALDNIAIFHERIENFQSTEQIDIVLCRAFAALDRLTRQTSHILNNKSKLLAMKGQFPEAEIAALPPEFEVRNWSEIDVPGLEGARHLIEVGRAQD